MGLTSRVYRGWGWGGVRVLVELTWVGLDFVVYFKRSGLIVYLVIIRGSFVCC